MTDTLPPLPGYRLHERRSPLTAPWEPIYALPGEDRLQLAVHVREAHCNGRGFAHGGLIAALADNAMGLSAVLAAQAAGVAANGAVTVSLTLDFVDSAAIGEWLEVQPHVLKAGRTLAFVECHVVAAGRVLARGSATFRLSEAAPPRPAGP